MTTSVLDDARRYLTIATEALERVSALLAAEGADTVAASSATPAAGSAFCQCGHQQSVHWGVPKLAGTPPTCSRCACGRFRPAEQGLPLWPREGGR